MTSSSVSSTLEEFHGEVLHAMAPTTTALLSALMLTGTLPIFYNTFQILKHVDHILDWVASQCELQRCRPWQLQILGRSSTIIASTPEMIEDVSLTQFESFGKGAYAEENGYDFFGSGIFVADGHRWVQQRKTASTLLIQRALREYMMDTANEQAQVLIELLQREVDYHERVDMSKLFNRFTFEMFTEIGFGVKIGGLKDDADDPFQTAFDTAQRLILQWLMVPSWFWRAQRYLNIGAEKELKSCMTLIDDTVYDIIAQSMKNRQLHSKATDSESSIPGRRKNLISLFLDSVTHDTKSDSNAANPGSGTQFDSKYLRNVIFNFLLVGRDTTTQTLNWFFCCSSQRSNTKQKVREELTIHLPGLGASCGHEAHSMEQLHLLVYLEAAIKETLRLYSSVPDNEKHYGMNVGYPGYVLGRMEHVWGPDAKKFKPEWWIDSDTGKLIAVLAFKFSAFHAEPRTCLGMDLAMIEIKTVAVVLLSKFRFALVPGQNIIYGLSITLPIKGSLMMQVAPNTPPSSC